MPVNHRDSQLNVISRLKNISATVIDKINEANVVAQEAIDLGYGTGGANAITDALLQDPPAGGTGAGAFPNLTTADVIAAVTTLQRLKQVLEATTVTTVGTTRVGYTALEKMR